MEYSTPDKSKAPAGYVPTARDDDERGGFGLLRYLLKPTGYVPVPNPLTTTHEPQKPVDPIDSLTNLRLGFDYRSKALFKTLLDDREALRHRERAELMGRISDLTAKIGAVRNLSYGMPGDRQAMDLEREKWQLEQELVNTDLRSWRDRLTLQERALQSELQYQKSKLRNGLMEDLSG